jgi:aryl-alcohol dehydrogenase-like predicted oxidoreductase
VLFPHAMQSRSVGRTDVRVSEIALGTWGLAEQSYGPVDPMRFDETVKAAIEKGVTTFDLAPLWGDGEGERRVGKILSEAKGDFVVASRGGARRKDGKIQTGFATDDLIADCEGSLERLGREAIDLWLLHGPGEGVLLKEAEQWKAAIEKLEQDGKIRAWGASVGGAEEARLAIAAGAKVLCLPYNLLRPKELDDLTSDLRTAGCGVMVRSPLMYGLLSGQWNAQRHFPNNDHRRERWTPAMFVERVRHVDSFRFLVDGEIGDMATAAIRFVLQHSAVSCALVGARSPYQISAAVEAAKGPPYLRDEVIARIARVRTSMSLD